MKKFITQLCVWGIIAFIFAILFDMMVSSGLKKTDIRKYAAWNDIYKGELRPDLVVLGGSNAWCGYNTYILDSVLDLDSYNLGIDGHGIDFQILRYDEYRRFNPKPKILLFNIFFRGTLGVSADSPYEREQFFPYIDDNTLMSKVAEAKKITWTDKHLPLIRYYGYRDDVENGMASFFGRTEFFDGGMHKNYRGNNYLWESGILSKDTLVEAATDLKMGELLESFTKHAIEEDVKVVYVKSPIYYPYRAKVINIERSDSIYESLSRKYNIPILDYYFSSISMDSTNFYNPGHLNKKGSELFTMELCHDLDSLGIIQKKVE